MKKKNTTKQTLPRNQRLSKARNWLKLHVNEQHLLKKYKKQFKVDNLCAIKDLELIRYKFPNEYVESIKKQEKAKAEKSRQKREAKVLNEYIDCDDTFAYIAGYTSNGVPYGITWEEMEKLENDESKLPF